MGLHDESPCHVRSRGVALNVVLGQPGTWLALPAAVYRQASKRVAVAITSDDGNTLCGFRTMAPPADAGRLFASSVTRFRLAGQSEGAPVILSIQATRESYDSLWEAQRGLERALDLASPDKPTRELRRSL